MERYWNTEANLGGPRRDETLTENKTRYGEAAPSISIESALLTSALHEDERSDVPEQDTSYDLRTPLGD